MVGFAFIGFACAGRLATGLVLLPLAEAGFRVGFLDPPDDDEISLSSPIQPKSASPPILENFISEKIVYARWR